LHEFRLLVAKPQVKNGLSWLVVRGNATRPLFRAQKTTVNVKHLLMSSPQ
jgi:hypothetical protein